MDFSHYCDYYAVMGTVFAAEVTFPPLPRLKLVLDLATSEGGKAGLS